jgi:hypothetical protein
MLGKIIITVKTFASAVNFVPAMEAFPSPLKKDTKIGTLSIEPAGWSGEIHFIGDNAGLVYMTSQNMDVFAAQDINNAGTYEVTVNVAP